MTLRDYVQARGLDPANGDNLAAAAYVARRFGISPRLEDLVDQQALDAWSRAEQALEVEFALRISMALQSPDAVLAELDGGASLLQARARTTARALAAHLRGAREPHGSA